jgi:hypothetical protein
LLPAVAVLVPAALICWRLGRPDVTGFSGNQSAVKDHDEIIRQGNNVVKAIFHFRHDVGLWPCCLEETCPTYINAADCAGWSYAWKANGKWSLTWIRGQQDLRLIFRTYKKEQGWWITDGVDSQPIEAALPIFEFGPSDSFRQAAKAESQLRLRLAMYPTVLVHRKGFVGWLRNQKRCEEALSQCGDCISLWPKHWWPRLASALIASDCGLAVEAEKQLGEYVGSHPEIGKVLCLAVFANRAGNTKLLEASLVKGWKAKLVRFETDVNPTHEILGFRPDYLMWQVVLIAYHYGNPKLTIALCNHWEACGKEDMSLINRDYFAIRAACYLQLGLLEEARKEIAALRKTPRNVIWADKSDDLICAVDTGDFSFRYDPGNIVGEIEVFPEYQ